MMLPKSLFLIVAILGLNQPIGSQAQARNNTSKPNSPIAQPGDIFLGDWQWSDGGEVFHITLEEVKERILPDLDDEFAKDLGTFETLADLRADVAKQVEKQLNEQSEEDLAQQLVNALCEANPIAVPPSLVRKQSELTEREMRQQMRRQGQNGDLPTEVRERLAMDSEKRVQAGLLMAAIAKSQNVTITSEDIEKAYEELSEQTGKNVARLKAEYRDQEKQQILQGMILEDKILKLIQEKAVITEAAKDDTPAASSTLKQESKKPLLTAK